MTAIDFEQILASVNALTPSQREELRRQLDSLSRPTLSDTDEAFARKLVELGIGQPRPPGPRGPNPPPVVVHGTPLSEQLIRERR